MKRQSTGIALISTLMVAVIVTLVVVAISNRLQLEIARAGHLSHHAQRSYYATSAENWARRVLAKDNTVVDSLDDDWATVVPKFAVGAGVVSGHMIDMQSKINLNSLMTGDRVNPATDKQLRSLLRALGIDENLVAVLLDWMDEDQDERFAGAEDGYYSRRSPSYQTANRKLTDLVELKLLKGVTPNIYHKLEPFVTVLPFQTPVNVNTAPPEVLEALGFGGSVEEIVRQRKQRPFNSVEEFLKLVGGGAGVGDQRGEGLAVASRYFLLDTRVTLADGYLRQNSLLFRETRTAESIRRWYF